MVLGQKLLMDRACRACLGVKNVVGPLVMSARQCEEFTGQFFGAYPEPPLAATLELAQDLVCGAVEYARSLRQLER